jgi:BioD-like phosphotransacetylase family protein
MGQESGTRKVIRMNRLVVASTRPTAGKTSMILGLARMLGKKVGYMKPFGDRLLYKKKRLWDYDSALLTEVLGLSENPEDISIGFEHSKLWYMYDEDGIRGKLKEMVDHIGKDKEVLFIEAGKDLTYGNSVHLDALSIAKYLDARLLVVLHGPEGPIVDDIAFICDHVKGHDVDLAGVIINKVADVDDFKGTYMDTIDKFGVKVLGILPRIDDLAHTTIGFLAEALFAKVVTGERGLGNKVKNIFVGAMGASAAQRSALWKMDNKLIITSGDRHDMIIAALETDTAGIVLSNNLLPPAHILAKASERDIPMLLMSQDTFQVAKMVDDMEMLLTVKDERKFSILEKLVKGNVDLDGLLG